MSDITIKTGDTAVIEAELPRDLADASGVELHIGEESPATVTTPIRDASANLVGIPLSAIDASPGRYAIEFEITYDDGSVETVPHYGYDRLRVVEDLA